MTPIEQVLDRLDRVKQNGPDSWIASCPVGSHGRGRGDANPSLSIKFDGDKVLLNCMSGCHTQDVMLAAGLDWPDLFASPLERPFTVATWTYCKPDGSIYFTVERQQTGDGKRFVQRVPGHDRPGYPTGFKPSIYRLPQVLAEAKKGGEVFVVEGEKCVHAAESLGLVATTSPNGSKGWRDYYAAWFVGCARVTVVCDNDDAGQEYAATVTVSLRARNIPVRTMRVAVTADKADLYDHVLAGFGVEQLIPFKVNRLRPEGTTTEVLLHRTYPPVKWAVRGLLPAGLAILGGPPKAHKSFLALDLAVGCAVGDHALHHLECEQGSVLYLSLDNDSERRLQWRVKQILTGSMYAMVPIEFHTDWPTGIAAIGACQEWCEDERDEGRKPLLVVADTLARVEPAYEGDGRQSAYLASNNALSAWSRFATDNDVVVLGVHHDRKTGDEDDWMNRLMGSRGITAAAQTIMFIDGKRGQSTALLRVAGRDVGSADYELERSGPWWRFTDAAGAEWESERERNEMARAGRPVLSIV
jgi:hypothetical protein